MTAAQGATYTAEATFYQYANGPAADVTNLTIGITRVSDGAVIVAATSSGITHAATGVYTYLWSIVDTAQLGDYIITWTADQGTATEVVTVVAGPATGTWCSVDDVPTICAGKTATAADVAAAQVILEGAIHRVWRSTDAEKRDYIWLKRACAWQAAFVHDHPEILTMLPIQSWSQDGMSFTLATGSGSAVAAYLAPLAMQQLQALFRGSNTTIRFNSAFQKNRVGRVGSGFGGSQPWTDI